MLTDTLLRKGRLKDGVHSDEDRLYLRVQGGRGERPGMRWQFVYQSPATGKRRELGLGAYPAVSLGVARKLAGLAREQVALGMCPVEHRRAEVERLRLEREVLARRRYR